MSNNKVDYQTKVLEVKNLRQYFKVGTGKKKIIVPAVNDVSFDVYKKEVFGIVGESGSGKTTVGRTVIGLYQPTAGTVKYDNNFIGYGIDGLKYDIKKIKKKLRTDLICLSPKAKEIYEAKNTMYAEIRSHKENIKQLKSTKKNIKDIVLRPFYAYEQSIQDLIRLGRLELSNIEKAHFLEKQKLLNSDLNTIFGYLNQHIKTSTARFNRKKMFLKDLKSSKEFLHSQYNTFFMQYVNEIKFAYDLFFSKVEKSKDLQFQVTNTKAFEIGLRLCNKFLKKTNNLNEVKEVLISLKDELENKQNSYKLIRTETNFAKAQQDLHTKLADIDASCAKESQKVHDHYDKLIADLPKVEKESLKDEIVRKKDEHNKNIDSLRDSIKKSHENYLAKKQATIKKYENSTNSIDENKKKELKYAAQNALDAKRKELNRGRAINKLKETPENKAIRLSEIKKVRDEYAPILTQLKQKNDPSYADVYQEYQNRLRKINDKKPSFTSLRASMQMIFQDPVSSLNPRMTVREIISEGLVINGERNKVLINNKINEVLSLVGLQAAHADRYPHEFSGGQRQRIGIARALIINPKFIIADEPISALDVSIQAQIINLLGELKSKLGLTILFIAHDLSVVKYFSDRIAVMFGGKIVELATSEELFKNPLHPYTKSLLSAIPEIDNISPDKPPRVPYTPMMHDYKIDKPNMVEITPGHFIYGNTAEINNYKSILKGVAK